MPYNPEKPYKKQILELIRETWRTHYISVREGAYPIFEKKFDYAEVDHTDGIGTKGVYHWRRCAFKNAVSDAIAMNLNDLALVRATPYKLQCHLILPEDDKKAILEIMRNLANECKRRKIAITGGETSIQNNIEGMEISLTMSGFVKKEMQNQFKEGDVLIGLKSNGLHSNGFTVVRRVFKNKILPEFTEPTRIYSNIIVTLNEKYNIHGMMHITGGAFTKLKDVIGSNDIIVTNTHTLKPQKIFQELYKSVSDSDMYQTFNCGIGFVLAAVKEDAQKIISRVKGADIIGYVVKGTGKVRIESMFSKRNIQL